MYKKKDSEGKLVLKEISRIFKDRWFFKKKIEDENEFTTLLKEKYPKFLHERKELEDCVLWSSAVDDANNKTKVN